MSGKRQSNSDPQAAIAAPRAATQARLSVRPATPLDAQPLSFFFDTALRDDYFLRRGQLDEMLRGKHHTVFVAELDTILVGVAVQTAGTRLVNVLVHPAYRGLGIGRELVRIGGATEVRCKLDMSAGNPRGFYAALGFKPTGQLNSKGNIETLRKVDADERGGAGRGQ
ncbi:MAG: GNAT family N-acetyltransferase [Phycisphaerae bacterium]|nr:GNAT family N-acetyltransferase [Phycisphaerae bacterium]